MSKHHVIVYGRPECHLCDQAAQRVRELAAESAVEIRLDEINIELDDELHRSMFERIPVTEIDGVLVGQLGDHRRRTFSDRVREAFGG